MALAEELNTFNALKRQAQDKRDRERDQFIQGRTRHEMVVNTLAENIPYVAKELLESITMPEVITPEALFPSLYKEVFDPAEYQSERGAFTKLQSELGFVLSGLLKESNKMMEAYLNESKTVNVVPEQSVPSDGADVQT